MAGSTTTALKDRTCKPCEGEVDPLSRGQAEQLLQDLDGWELTGGDKSIRRRWKVEDFSAGIEFLRRVAEIAEAEDHHPDVHLTGYRNVTIELTTHAIDGLSENDFILAAKIDQLEVPMHKTSR
jgi:4a-hydroxytetrahydrobiopterin dehydratase